MTAHDQTECEGMEPHAHTHLGSAVLPDGVYSEERATATAVMYPRIPPHYHGDPGQWCDDPGCDSVGARYK